MFYFPRTFSQVAPKFSQILHNVITKITQKSEKYLEKHTFQFLENFPNSFLIDCCARIIWMCVVSIHFYYWQRYSLSEIVEKLQRNFAWYFFWISQISLEKYLKFFLGVFIILVSMNEKYRYLSITVPEVSILPITSFPFLVARSPWNFYRFLTYFLDGPRIITDPGLFGRSLFLSNFLVWESFESGLFFHVGPPTLYRVN